MKRIPRALKAALAVAAASGVGLATVTAATADTPSAQPQCRRWLFSASNQPR